MKVKVFLVTVFILSACISHAQSSILEDITSAQDIGDYKEAGALLKKIDTTGFSSLQLGHYLYEKARIQINMDGEMINSYQTLLKAKRLVGRQNLDVLFKINDELIYSQYSLVQLDDTANELMDENCKIAQDTEKAEHLIGCNAYLYRQVDPNDPNAYQKQLKLLHNSRMLATQAGLNRVKGNTLINIAATHDAGKQYDSALYYHKKVTSYVEGKNHLPTTIAYHTNLGFTYMNLERYQQAIEQLNIALALSESQENTPYKSRILMNLATAYAAMENFEKSQEIYQQVIAYTNEVNANDRFKALQDLEARYQVQERKLENATLTAANERQKTWIIAVAGSALTLLLIGGFIYNNQLKKKRIALQEVELEKQRADNLMKNQELATIDAMIAGQEKERQRLAQELHDDLGSSLTTIRLYFENLKNHFKEGVSTEIYSRTDQLLEETYSTIRGMSHNRHHGVLASKGLIPSLEKLGKNLSDSGKIRVEIYHHNMDRKLENSLELNLFRMLQELLNNVVKHAHASLTSINIIGTQETISLMVEDNGKGFETHGIKKPEGMGLYSIETRVEEMGGTMEIDSSPGNGTTISIDIPLL